MTGFQCLILMMLLFFIAKGLKEASYDSVGEIDISKDVDPPTRK